jgi:hypothetical protein
MKLRRLSIRSSPAASAVERVGKALLRVASEDTEDDERFWSALEAAGLLVGLPIGSSQIGRTGRYITGESGMSEDLGEGDLAGVASGFVYGKRNEQPANPLTPFVSE